MAWINDSMNFYAGTSLGDVETRIAWMDKGVDAFESSDDPFIRMAVALYDADMQLEEETKLLKGRYQEARPQYMEALLAFKTSQGEVLYPDGEQHASRFLRQGNGQQAARWHGVLAVHNA